MPIFTKQDLLCLQPALTRAFLLALLPIVCAPAAQAQSASGARGWTTWVEPAARIVEPAVDGPFDTSLPLALERERLTVSLERPHDADPWRTEGGFLMVRRDLAPEAAAGPYFGAGLGVAAHGPGQEGDLTSAFFGGVAAPIAESSQIYGEYQHLRSLEGGGADDRFELGLRRKF